MADVRPDTLDLDRAGHVFVANVGGAGMSAVATLLAERGHRVSGHDPAPDTPFVEPLRRLGVEVRTGEDHPPLVDDVDAVVVSTATPGDMPEVAAARRRGVPVVHRKVALAELGRDRQVVSVAGTHGKTTTAALLATVLEGCGTEPGWVVGAPIPGLGRSASWGGKGPLVIEADESDGTFLELATDLAVVTNVEPDHLEHYGDFDALVGAFERFLAAATGEGAGTAAVVGADDHLASGLGRSAGAVSVGTDPAATVRVTEVTPVDPAGGARPGGAPGTAFALVREDRDPVEAVVPMPGVHNVRNAAVALVAAEAVGVPLDRAAGALSGFRGVGRRFEHRGTARGATLVDDYAHLPAEVAAALAAARDGGWTRVVCVFQPHRYSRTQALGRDFADAFGDADLLAVTDVYGAGEPPRPGVSGKLVVDAVLEAHPWRHVAYLPGLDDVVRWAEAVLRPGDVLLTLGAGDLTTLPGRLVDRDGAG